MAKLINGNGNPAVYAAQDADLIASICGDTTCIAAVGSEYAATQEDANTIGLADGVIITKEGRRIQLDAGYTDLFTIPTGTAGTTSYYIIGYKLKTESDSRQTCETFVQKMNSSSATIPEDTFRGGASEVYVSVYRVTQNGLNIQTIAKLLPTLALGSTVSSHTGSGSTVTNTIAAGKNLDEVTQTLLNNDYKINSALPNQEFVETAISISDTYGAILTRLEALIDHSKVNSNSKLIITYDNRVFPVFTFVSNKCVLEQVQGTPTGVFLTEIVIGATCNWSTCDSSTRTDSTSSTVPSQWDGYKAKFIY